MADVREGDVIRPVPVDALDTTVVGEREAALPLEEPQVGADHRLVESVGRNRADDVALVHLGHHDPGFTRAARPSRNSRISRCASSDDDATEAISDSSR